MFTRFEQEHIDPQYLTNIEAATECFLIWLREPYEFDAMLMSMHKMVSTGGYTGYTNTDSPQVITTGQFRGVNKEAWRPLLKKEWFTDVRVENGYVCPVLKASNLLDTHHLIDQPDGYELYLPHESTVPFFLEAMADAMVTLSHGFCAATLANYIQYFVVGHPFERINFSICMAQVNAILDHYGYERIYHEYLDFECFVYDYDRIEKIFAAKIKRRVT